MSYKRTNLGIYFKSIMPPVSLTMPTLSKLTLNIVT